MQETASFNVFLFNWNAPFLVKMHETIRNLNSEKRLKSVIEQNNIFIVPVFYNLIPDASHFREILWFKCPNDNVHNDKPRFCKSLRNFKMRSQKLFQEILSKIIKRCGGEVNMNVCVRRILISDSCAWAVK